jgi:hypothetical protein
MRAFFLMALVIELTGYLKSVTSEGSAAYRGRPCKESTARPAGRRSRMRSREGDAVTPFLDAPPAERTPTGM